jgi:hypothetical protein
MMTHEDWCEADPGHAHDCRTATELARLRSFAESVRMEFSCTKPDVFDEDHLPVGHEDDCWHHAAILALAKPGR